MTQYTITSSAGMDLGTYEGETARDAYEAMCHEAGYASAAAAEEATGSSMDELTIEANASATRYAVASYSPGDYVLEMDCWADGQEVTEDEREWIEEYLEERLPEGVTIIVSYGTDGLVDRYTGQAYVAHEGPHGDDDDVLRLLEAAINDMAVGLSA